MKSGKGYVIVQYDYGHMREADLGPVKIEIAREVNNDLKAGNDQRAKVIAVDSENSWLKEGDIVWTHYLASDKSNEININGEKYHRVILSQVFFKIDEQNNILDVAKGVHLCKQIVTEADKTESGIYLTPFTEKKESMRLEVTHASDNRYGIKSGDKIITKDDYHYTIDFYGQEIVKMDADFILAVYE